jgi:serine/threonine protein phosphatase 1
MQIRMDEKGRILFMATYVISDIHGEYERFMELLEEIELKDTDTLYILGDILDRGEHPIKVVLKLMEMPNAFCIVGNHEVMALECLRFLCQEITDLAIEEVDAELLDNLVRWKYNGGDATIREFRALDPEMREEVLNFLEDFSLYEELTVGEKQYLLVHGGLGGFTPEKRIEEYSLHDLVWARPDYQKEYFADTNLVTGHTPTQTIPENDIPGIFIKNITTSPSTAAHASREGGWRQSVWKRGKSFTVRTTMGERF